jgi:RNA polymerase sigma factor (sigma-70 family)
MGTINDSVYLNGILKHDRKIIRQIYNECYPMVRKLVLKGGGDSDLAKDIFQDTIMLIYRKVQTGDIRLFCKFSTYFYGVSKKIWLQEMRGKSRFSSNGFPALDLAEEAQLQSFDDDKYRNTVLKHFENLSSDCKKILRLHFNKASIDEIHAIMGYGTRHHTIDRKYRCKRSLIRRILSDPHFKYIKNEYAGQN